MNMISCPQCKGKKEITGLFPCYNDNVPQEERKPVVFLPCPRCNSKGEVPEEMLTWIEKGAKIKAKRIDEEGITLRQKAKKLGIRCSELSNIERGCVDPDLTILRME